MIREARLSPFKANTLNIGSHAAIDRVEIAGTIDVPICTLRFYNGDEEDMSQHVEVICVKSDHPTQCILIPTKKVQISDYCYCHVKVYAGKLHSSDELILYYHTLGV